jgi:hypothetical protein
MPSWGELHTAYLADKRTVVIASAAKQSHPNGTWLARPDAIASLRSQ